MKKLMTLLIVSMLLTACQQVVAGSSPIATFTPTVTLAPTETASPEFTPTHEIPLPSVPNGLRPENAAKQRMENGIWTVRNIQEQITATWNAETKQWVYIPENIKIKYTIGGYTGDQADIEAYVDSPLPPDAIADHFIDPATGKPVPYGIGPEIIQYHSISGMNFSCPATEVFVRFRGVAALLKEIGKYFFSAKIFEIPQSADRSFILVVPTVSDNMGIIAAPDNTLVLDENASHIVNVERNTPGGVPWVEIINDHLIGHMAMIIIEHDIAPHIQGTSVYDVYVARDRIARTIFDYISGISTQIPVIDRVNRASNVEQDIVFPESQFADIPTQ